MTMNFSVIYTASFLRINQYIYIYIYIYNYNYHFNNYTECDLTVLYILYPIDNNYISDLGSSMSVLVLDCTLYLKVQEVLVLVLKYIHKYLYL